MERLKNYVIQFNTLTKEIEYERTFETFSIAADQAMNLRRITLGKNIITYVFAAESLEAILQTYPEYFIGLKQTQE